MEPKVSTLPPASVWTNEGYGEQATVFHGGGLLISWGYIPTSMFQSSVPHISNPCHIQAAQQCNSQHCSLKEGPAFCHATCHILWHAPLPANEASLSTVVLYKVAHIASMLIIYLAQPVPPFHLVMTESAPSFPCQGNDSGNDSAALGGLVTLLRSLNLSKADSVTLIGVLQECVVTLSPQEAESKASAAALRAAAQPDIIGYSTETPTTSSDTPVSKPGSLPLLPTICEMGRPKLYNTQEEKKEAMRANKRAYYARNKTLISAKMKIKYQEHVSVQDPSKYVLLLARVPVLHANENTVQIYARWDRFVYHQVTQQVSCTNTRLQEYLGMSARDATEQLLEQFLETWCLDAVRSAISALEEIVQDCRLAEEDILQDYGVGPRFKEAAEASRAATSTLSTIEELFCYASLDTAKLKEKYTQGNLLFQSL
ncbi:hypothetical protein JVT61DRAFT_10383 [Boletus reticuloceps]|uniref:Uncharacterized protein n=1 Tax=Boletus reticuloceps TaxID=495285 RepID=A0A8I2YV22_9AGAM|nr:hypothetical protein JVT61DRAFT_10383 [Boletus reticuloceps]